jgi:hypothetical protein
MIQLALSVVVIVGAITYIVSTLLKRRQPITSIAHEQALRRSRIDADFRQNIAWDTIRNRPHEYVESPWLARRKS